MKCEKIYLKPEVDALQAEVQRLNNEKCELLDELREIRNHLQAIEDFINGSDNNTPDIEMRLFADLTKRKKNGEK